METPARPGTDVGHELRTALDGLDLVEDPDVLSSLAHDDGEWAEVGRPLGALRARSSEEVGRAVRACAELGVPVVTRGAGTGLSGGANATENCLLLDLSRMNRILEIDAENLRAVVQPGVINDELTKELAEHGLWYPPDPASSPWSTLGGNAATNAGGLCCLKYGVTRDYVLGMRAVMGGPAGPYGTEVRLGRATAKGVAGYDLAGLLVGSEGTLGVITELTLRLRPLPRENPRTVVGAFGSLVEAGRAVALCTGRGLRPAALELLDRSCMRAVEDWKHLGIEPDTAALLLARVDTPGDAGTAEATELATAFTDGGAAWTEQSTDATEAEALFAARRLAYPALERLGPVLTEDVCVPQSAVPDMLARVEEIGKRHQARIATIAHAGDGNLHPLLLAPPDDEQAKRAAQAAFEDILSAALELGGTVTGEHGVGLLKREGMERELGPEVCAVQDAVKQALDPLNLFNPTKVVDPAQA
ncbi:MULTISPECIES: FAD-linked oxidase C-terminal domain-containing protein [unclassified Actinopolyspora]|uniref:FAD-binding oxidoreductase n=1 Tax=unclassified Actinopolyspora TaxID=2639451 RepID=UPI0013F64C44|nr:MULTISPECIES: FAD-linked oxidase C-terminal domain-containing protein [unclassified Actinopolyspora]NHD18020.1 FAD-binding protein [Actinopolyspora sp. BKK2]NHE78657.1 FAD-binding protein [Actinopolyspora sp. BKK1]